MPVRDLLKAAGYLEEAGPNLGEEEEVELAFRYVMSDPRYKPGARVKGKLTTDVKRFIVEMYENATKKKLLPYTRCLRLSYTGKGSLVEATTAPTAPQPLCCNGNHVQSWPYLPPPTTRIS